MKPLWTKKGEPFVRFVNGYKKGEDKNRYQSYLRARDELSMILAAANIKTESPINSKSDQPSKNGQKGGNIESTNEGFCLIGDADLSESEWNELAVQNCGRIEETIKLPTAWMPAKHVDELVKALPQTKNSSCDASFAISSPRKALDILSSHPDDLFFDPSLKSDSTYMYDRSALSNACATVLVDKKYSEELFIVDKISSLPQFQPMTPAAGTTTYRMPFSNDKNAGLFRLCSDLKNRELVELFKSNAYYVESLRISQQKIEDAKQKITSFYKEKRPDCVVRYVEVPTLFVVDQAKYFSEDHGLSVVATTSQALLPNALNNLKINQDIFVPTTANKHLDEYIKSIFIEVGLRPHFLNTFRLHVSGGNIHFSSQTIHRCQKSGKKAL